MNTLMWFQADIAPGLGAAAQYGAVGIAALLLWVHYKLMTDYRESIDHHTETMREVCVALERLKTMIELQRKGGS